MKRPFVCAAMAVLAATAAVSATVGTAGALPEPVGGCPKGGGWILTLTSPVEWLDNGSFHDQNGDGFRCIRFNAGQTAKNVYYSYVWRDNTNPLP